MKEFLSKDVIPMRAARELKDGDVVNVGVGLPMLTRNYVPPDIEVIWHSENGAINFGRLLTEDEQDKGDIDYTSAGGQFFLPQPGTSFVDHATSFIVIRGGRLDVAIIGGMQVSEQRDLSNWTWDVEGRAGGIGGSMDLVMGAKKVIVTMTHVTRERTPKVVKECDLPVTGRKCVDTLISDLGVFDFTPQGIQIREIAPGWTFEEVQALTEPTLVPSPDMKVMEL